MRCYLPLRCVVILVSAAIVALAGCGVGSFGVFKALDQKPDRTFIPLSTGSIDEAAVLLSRDEWRGIPIPYSLSPEGRVPTDAVIQWRFDGDSSFPALPEDIDAIRAALRNPEEAARLQICTESPPAAAGFVSCLPDSVTDNGRRARILGLGDVESWAFSEGLIGQEFQVLRASDRPSETDLPTRGPRSIIPLDRGVTGLVLDESSSSGSRLREIDFATGEVIRTVVESVPGTPNAMISMSVDTVLVASNEGALWALREIELETGITLSRVERPSELDGGEIFGLASLGGRAVLFTVGSSLIEMAVPVDESTPEFDPIVHFSTLASPRGLAVDPTQGRKGVFLAESGTDRILKVDVLARTRSTFASVEEPQSLAFDRDGVLILAVVNDGAEPGLELVGFPLGGVAANGEPFIEIQTGYDSQTAGVFVGPDNLRLIALKEVSKIALSGGIEQIRLVDSYDPLTQVISVDSAFNPELDIVQSPRQWRILDKIKAFVGNTRREIFVWNSADAKTSGRVILGLTPIANRKGVTTEIRVGKRITSAIDVPGEEIEDDSGDLFQDPRTASPADMDNDGDLDLVIVSKLSGEVLILPQINPGVFDTDSPTALTAGLNLPNFADVGDFNQDGRFDIAVTNEGVEEITVFIQLDNFAFSSTNIPIGGFARSVRFANLGPPDDELEFVISRINAAETVGDVVVIDPVGADLGTFSLITRALTRFPLDARAVDLNGDSLLDIVTIGCVDPDCGFLRPDPDNPTEGLCEILFQNTDTFGFNQRRELNLGPTGNTGPLRPFALGVEDIDGDRDIDIVVGVATGLPSTDRVRLFLNDGDGFTQGNVIDFEGEGINGPTMVSLVDMNGDGRRDLVTSSFGGSRVQDPGVITVSFQPNSGFVTDDDGVVIPQVPNTILKADRLVNVIGAIPLDLNGDGRPDILALSENTFANGDDSVEGTVSLFLAKDPGDYQLAPEFFGVDGVLRNPTVVAGDFNGDGALDLVTANASSVSGGEQPEGGNSLTVFFQEFLGRIDPSADIIKGDGDFGFPLQNPFDIVATDLDGDGGQDLAVVSRDGNNVVVYIQDENGTFQNPIVLENESIGILAPIAIAAGDLDCDGDVDLVIANSGGGGNVVVLPQTSPGEFCTRIGCGALRLTSPNPRDVVVADVTGDGRPDVISTSDSSVLIFDLSINDGQTPFELTAGLSMPMSLATGDLNRDGHQDVAVTNEGSDAIVVFFQGAFDNPLVLSDASMMGESFVAIADLNSDGAADIVAANRQEDGSITVFRQLSDRVFSQPRVLTDPALTFPRGILPVDLDRDSDTDLVIPINNNTADGILVFFGGQ